MAQKPPSEFLLNPSGIQHRVPRRTLLSHTAQASVNASARTRGRPLGLRKTWTLLRQSRLPSCLRWRKPHQQRPLRSRRHICIASYAGWLTVHVRPHQREVCSLAGGVMSQPLSSPLQVGIRFLPPPLPAALSGRLAAPLPVGYPGEQRAYHVPRVEPLGGLGRASTPVVQHLRVPSSERHNLTTYLLVQA